MAFTWWPMNKTYFYTMGMSDWRVKSEIRDFFKEVNQVVDQSVTPLSRCNVLYLFPPNLLSSNIGSSLDYVSMTTCVFANGAQYQNSRTAKGGIQFDGFTSYLVTALKPNGIGNTPDDSHLSIVLSELGTVTSAVQYNFMGVFDSTEGQDFSLFGIPS